MVCKINKNTKQTLTTSQCEHSMQQPTKRIEHSCEVLWNEYDGI